MKLPGWKRNGPVYDHASGMRLHLSGLLRLPSGELHHANHWPESGNLFNFVRLVGGSSKRAMMAWAMSKLGAIHRTTEQQEQTR